MQVSSNLPDNSISQIELPSRSNNKNNIENIPKLEQVDSLIKNLKPKRYAAVKPKIVLEVISAQSAKLILALTYLTFAFCMSLDIYAIYDGFRNNNYTIRPTLIESSKYNGTYVCNNTVTNLVNIYSVQITGTQHNTSLELLINSECVETTVTYNYQLWGCFKAQGCGNNFKEIPSFEEASEVWQKVYFSKDISQSVSICAGSVVTIPFLNKAFQPQVK